MLGVKINKFFLATIGAVLPNKRHPLGKISNSLRCHFARQICEKVGKNCVIERGATILENVVLYDNSAVGVNCEIGPGTIIKGNNMMGPNVHIYTQSHFYNKDLHRFDGFSNVEKVIIGENTWIGYGVVILPGVEIGPNSIIGAGSVVTKSIPAGVMAAGNPCVVKKIIDDEINKKM